MKTGFPFSNERSFKQNRGPLKLVFGYLTTLVIHQMYSSAKQTLFICHVYTSLPQIISETVSKSSATCSLACCPVIVKPDVPLLLCFEPFY